MINQKVERKTVSAHAEMPFALHSVLCRHQHMITPAVKKSGHPEMVETDLTVRVVPIEL